jgi:outer membrane protein OmpA-like peptidoglycan-associated protein
MQRFTILLLFFLTLSNLDSQAQTADAPNAIAWRFTWNNFQFPITEELSRYDYTSGGEFVYARYLNRYLNVAVPLKAGKARLPLNDEGNEGNSVLIASVDVLGQVKLMPEKHWFYPYLLAGAGIMAEPENGYNLNPEIPFGLGLNFKVMPGVYISGETQYRLNFNDNRNQLMHSVGAWFTIGAKDDDQDKEDEIADTDMDGIPDEEDQCPNEPGEKDLFGCPDRDGDGVTDSKDECPDVAGYATFSGCPDSDDDGVPNHIDECPTLKGDIDNKGCPKNDADGDGIVDSEDRCPEKAGSPFTEGCPDLDLDGIPDIDDLCPSEAGLPENRGCPDTDKDGVADPFDKCPNTPGIVYNDGCPELKKEEKEVLEFAAQAVQFETGSSRLKSESKKILDQIAGIMKNYPEQKLRISGHTDSIGTAEDNLDLSKRRAKSCFDYLVSRGIPASRMTHHGYGETLPIADNMYAPGREKNRRVVFEIFVD